VTVKKWLHVVGVTQVVAEEADAAAVFAVVAAAVFAAVVVAFCCIQEQDIHRINTSITKRRVSFGSC